MQILFKVWIEGMSDGTYVKYCKSIWAQLWIWVPFSISWFSVMTGSTAHTCLLEVTKNPENGTHILSLKESGFQQASCPRRLACPRNAHHRPPWAAAHHRSCKHQNKTPVSLREKQWALLFSSPQEEHAVLKHSACACVWWDRRWNWARLEIEIHLVFSIFWASPTGRWYV